MQGVCAQSFGQFQPFSLMFGVSKNHRLPSVGSNIEQRKWCRTTEIWRIGVNENVRQFFGQCEVNPRQSWMIWIPRCGSRIPSTGFWIPCFRIPADFLSWTPRIPDSTSKDLPVSGIWIPYVIPYTERNTLTYMGRSCFPRLPYVHFHVINTLIAFM